MCDPYSKLSFAFDQYYQSQNKVSTACDFGGNAKTQSGSTSSNCKAGLSQAGSAGAGTVTSVPTGTGSSNGGSTSPSSTKKNVAGQVTVPRFDIGMLQLGVYVVAAGMAGVGMVLL